MLRVVYNDTQARQTMAGVARRNTSYRRPLRVFHQYMRKEISDSFHNRRRGGFDRGVFWNYFKWWYFRKDGTVVHPWGGIRKARGTGRVKGRKRPSGRRVTSSSSIVQDTGALRRDSGTLRSVGPTHMTMRPRLRYAQHQQSMRPFMYFKTPQDVTQLTRLMQRYLMRK